VKALEIGNQIILRVKYSNFVVITFCDGSAIL
jgi:hypothetical protein